MNDLGFDFTLGEISQDAGGSGYFSEMDLDWPYRERHPLLRLEDVVRVAGDVRRGIKPFPHPFPARMPLEVALAAVEAVTSPGDTILDPMMGSGVVPRAGAILGRKSIGTDLDPLAVAQARALCSHISVERFDELCHAIKMEAVSLLGSEIVRQCTAALPPEDVRFLDYWFPSEHVDELFALALALEKVGDDMTWPIGAVLISSLIISRGSGASFAMDLSRSRPHKVTSKTPRSPIAEWHRKVNAFRRYYASVSKADHGPVLRTGDARSILVDDGSVDAIVTSPPYLNAIDYLRTSKFTLIFFGSRLAELREIRGSSVGTERGLPEGVMSPHLDALVREGVTETGRRPLVRRYLHDLQEVLSESFRVLKPSGRAIFVMGPSIISRRKYDSADVLGSLAKEGGFKLLGHGRRDIAEERRSLPPPKRSKRSESMNKRMSCEYFVAFEKAV